MKYTYDSLIETLLKTPPWFYPVGLGFWIKPIKEGVICGKEEAGLMWPDMEDTDDWVLLGTILEKPNDKEVICSIL